MKSNKYHSYNSHQLPKGCQLCIKGRKTVLYITGLCPRNCYFCPLSDNRKNKDVIFANEVPVKKINEIIKEIKISKSKGIGITGGDPLIFIDRTAKTIKALKKEFGSSFHIHLYTSLNLVNEKRLSQLYKSGLDEIRFHPDLDDQSLWLKIKLANNFPWKIGIEIPCIPGKYKEIKKLIRDYSRYINFLNLNELEISDTNANQLSNLGFKCKNNISYAIKGSQELALKILIQIRKELPDLPTHYCTAKLKDSVQLANRLKLRAKSIKQSYQLMDKEGMLIQGIIYANENAMKKIKAKYKIPNNLISYDKKNKQTVIAPWILLEIRKKIPYKNIIRKEYPTYDKLMVEEF